MMEGKPQYPDEIDWAEFIAFISTYKLPLNCKSRVKYSAIEEIILWSTLYLHNKTLSVFVRTFNVNSYPFLVWILVDTFL